MRIKIINIFKSTDIEKVKKMRYICSYIEKNITKENLSINGGTLNYRNLTYDSDILLLAVMNGNPIGYASLIYNGDSIYVYQIAIKKEYQQKGIGTSLMTRAIKIACELGLDVTANVMDYNTNSKKMFKRLGFIKLGYTGENDGYYRLYQKSKNRTF